MGNCCYYLCCFGCCGICCRKSFVKTCDLNKKKKSLKILRDISPEGLRRMSSTADPTNRLLSNLTTVHRIPEDNYHSEQDVFKSYGYILQSEQHLGSGSFGQVYKALHMKTGTQIACKMIDLPLVERTQDRRLTEMKNELFVLETTNHPHLLKLISHFMIVDNQSSVTPNEPLVRFFLLMQFAENGTLHNLLQRFGPFSESQCKLWFAQILSALSFMHGKGIAHRDLKLGNVLLDENYDAIVSDFGLSRVVWRMSEGGLIESTTYCGTPPYLAPEVLIKRERKDEDTHKSTYNAFLVDVWALGVLLYILFNKDFPFNIQNVMKAIKKMRQKKWQFTGNNSDLPTDDLRSILRKLLDPDPNQRPTVTKLKNHPWVKDAYIEVEKNVVKVNSIRNSTI